MRIYLFGTFGDLKSLPIGGGQTSARRIWHTLENLGISVEITNRHCFSGPPTYSRKIKTMFGMFFDAIHWFCKIMTKSKKDAIAMVIGYAGIMATFDYIIIRIAFLLGYKTIYYLKGGGTETLYERCSLMNKLKFKKTILSASQVLVEGEENMYFVNKVSGGNTPVSYLPNYVEDSFILEDLPEKPSDSINILYFGRIEKSKNIKLIVEVFNLIAARYGQATLSIVGQKGTEYSYEVDDMIMSSPYYDRITRLDQSSHRELARILRDKHIFLFPSNEAREGHSNALTEAMAWGLVPIVSRNNFLPSIVGDTSLVVEGFKAEDYANTIFNLIEGGLIERKSKQMYYRVKDNYTQKIVENRLRLLFRSLR